MTMPNSQSSHKKLEERAHVELFLRRYAGAPEWTLEDFERPDFILHTPMGPLGIEHTRLRIDPDRIRSLREREGNEEQTLREGERLCEVRGLPPMCIDVAFDENFTLWSRRVDPLVETVVGLVAARIPEPPAISRLIEHDWFSWPDPVPEEIDTIHIDRPPEITRHFWTTARASIVGELDPAIIQTSIERKRSRYTACRRRCESVWLLVVAEGDAPSSCVDLTSVAKSHTYDSPFDRIFFLEAFDRRVTPLLVRQAQGF